MVVILTVIVLKCPVTTTDHAVCLCRLWNKFLSKGGTTKVTETYQIICVPGILKSDCNLRAIKLVGKKSEDSM